MTAAHHYPQPRGNYPHQAPPHHHHHNHLFLNSSLITPPSSHSSGPANQKVPFSLPKNLMPFPLQHGWKCFSPVGCVVLLSLLFLHHSFHLVGSLYRPVVAQREPDPRPLSLAPPTPLCTQRGGSSPVQTSVLMRANSFSSHGLRFPVLPAGEARLIGGYLQEEIGPRL